MGRAVTPNESDQEIFEVARGVGVSFLAGWMVSRGWPIWVIPSSVIVGFVLKLAWRGFKR